MADRNRRGRSVDDDGVDEPIEDVYDDEDLDDADSDDLDADLDDDLDDEEEEKAPARRSRAGTATRERERAAARRTRTDARPNAAGWLARRFRETVAELQKVIWPTRKELLTYTAVVVIFVAVMMTIVALLDVGFARLMFLIFGHSKK